MKLLFGTALMAIGVVAAASVQAGPTSSAEAERQRLTQMIDARWGPFVEATFHTSAEGWRAEMEPLLRRTTLAALRRAASADDFEMMNDSLLAGASPGPQVVTPKLSTPETTFVSITPCRIIDTRVAGGVLAAGSTRSFRVRGFDFSGQGGDASDCGVSQFSRAAMINFTVVTPNAAGFITAWPHADPRPLAATVNYVAGDIRGNLAVVGITPALQFDISVYTFAQTHLVGDIVGYFQSPESPDFVCVRTAEAADTMPAGGTGAVNAPACAANQVSTSVNCETTSSLATIYIHSEDGCRARNPGTTTATLRASRTCCRVF